MAKAAGWLDSIKETLRIDELVDKIKAHKSILIDIGIFSFAGFIFGILIKKYGNYMISLALFIMGLVILQYVNLINISINWTNVEQVFGVHKSVALENGTVLTVFWEWVKDNMVRMISFTVGLLIGLRVG